MNALVLQPRDLVPVEVLRERLALVTTVPDATAVADAAEATRVWAARVHLGLDVSNHCVAIRTEAEARTGELLREMRERGLLAGHGGDRRSRAGRGLLNLDDLVERHLGPISAAAGTRRLGRRGRSEPASGPGSRSRDAGARVRASMNHDQLAAERVRRGLLQRDIAARLGITPRRIASLAAAWRPAAAAARPFLRAFR